MHFSVEEGEGGGGPFAREGLGGRERQQRRLYRGGKRWRLARWGCFSRLFCGGGEKLKSTGEFGGKREGSESFVEEKEGVSASDEMRGESAKKLANR